MNKLQEKKNTPSSKRKYACKNIDSFKVFPLLWVSEQLLIIWQTQHRRVCSETDGSFYALGILNFMGGKELEAHGKGMIKVTVSNWEKSQHSK